MRKQHALARRLIDRQEDYLRFTRGWRIPADNNGTERDIRMIKLRQKISGCLRILIGAQHFCAIRSYLSTAAKHGKHLFEALVMLAEAFGRLFTKFPNAYRSPYTTVDPIQPPAYGGIERSSHTKLPATARNQPDDKQLDDDRSGPGLE
jgi:hypothetical protein